jgi:hypothetical protein
MGFREGNKHLLDLDVELVTVIPEDSRDHIFIFRVM